MGLELIIEDPRWRDLNPLATRAVAETLVHLGLNPEDWEVTLMGCDDQRIAGLNRDFRQRPGPTNVLSWPSAERRAAIPGSAPTAPGSHGELGDIAIAYETCMKEAKASGIPPEDHVTHLIVHGVLHLLGYDHERNRDADLMESLETAILCKLGVPDPYRDQGRTGLYS